MMVSQLKPKSTETAHVVYIDDSKDEKLSIFSAIAIPAARWRESFELVKAFRKSLRKTDGILLRKELHATDFVAGRGSLGAPKPIHKFRRATIFNEAISLVASLPGVFVTNVCMPKSNEDIGFERLLNRINRTLEARSSYATIISDRGKEIEYTKLCRKLSVHNPIPSRFGVWESGKEHKNIPLDRVLDDLVFKDSETSYFIQLADFCAYALLRRENPLASKTKYGLDKSFMRLDKVLNRAATSKDPEGIIRP